MEKIEARILFKNDDNPSLGTSIGMMLVIGFSIFLLFFFLWFGPEPNTISIVNYILLIIILGYIVHISQSLASEKSKLKQVLFEYKPEEKAIRILVHGADAPRIIRDFKINTEIQTRVSSSESRLIRKKFFLLQIVSKNGKAFNVFEEITEKTETPNIKTNPEIQYSFSIPVSIDPFPGQIFKLYNLLKENHLESK